MSSRGLAELAHHFGGRGASGWAPARDRVLGAGRSRGAQGAGLRRGRRPLRLRAGARHRRSAPAGRDTVRARHGAVPRRPIGRRDGGVPEPRRRSPATSVTPSCSRPPRSGSRRRAGARASPTRAPSSCWRRRHGRSASDDSDAARDAARRAWVARTRSSATTRPARPRRTQAIAMARRLGDAPGLATVLMRSYWTRGRRQHGGNPRDAARGPRPRRGRRRHRSAGRGDGVARGRPDLHRRAAPSAERELADVHALAVRLRQPFTLHVAEHYASTLALCAGNLADAEAAAQRSHEWSRLLTGRAASGTYGIQMFGIRREQGRLAELAAATRILAASEHSRGAWRPGFAALLVELGMEDEARRELARVRREGFERTSLHALAGVADLPGRRLRAGRRHRAGRVAVSTSWHRWPGGNVVIGHGVACYGAADRYLGLLAATLRRTRARDRPLRTRARLQPRDGRDDVGRAHPVCVRPDAAHARHRRRQRAGAGAGLRGGDTGRAHRDARAAGTGTALGARSAHRPRPHAPRSSSPGERSKSFGSWPPASAIARSESKLHISGHTVANHVRSILRKTGAANRTEAAGYAHRHALVDRPDER